MAGGGGALGGSTVKAGTGVTEKGHTPLSGFTCRHKTGLLTNPNTLSSSVKGSQEWINLCSVVHVQYFIVLAKNAVNEYLAALSTHLRLQVTKKIFVF